MHVTYTGSIYQEDRSSFKSDHFSNKLQIIFNLGEVELLQFIFIASASSFRMPLLVHLIVLYYILAVDLML